MLRIAHFDETDPYDALPSVASIRAAVREDHAVQLKVGHAVGMRAAAVLAELFYSELCLSIFNELAPWDALAASQVCRRLRHVAQSRSVPRGRRPHPLPPLPTELWLKIFRYLWDDGMLAAAQVCRRWRAIALGEQGLWTTVTLETCDGTPALSVFGLEQVLARSGVRTIWLRRSVVGDVLPAWEAAVGAALAPHAARIHGLCITYEDAAQLAGLPVFAGVESPFRNLRELELAASPLEDAAGADDELGIGAARLLALDNDGPRFPNLRSCDTQQGIFWQDVPDDMCPALVSLDMFASSVDEVLNAVRACPVLETLSVVVDYPVDQDAHVDAALAARIRALRAVSVCGFHARAICDRLLAVLAHTAPRERFTVECWEFWYVLAALFVGLQGLCEFSHDFAGGMHTIRATNAQGHERQITSPSSLGDDGDAESWKDFYGRLRDTLAPLPQEAVVVPAQYRSLIVS